MLQREITNKLAEEVLSGFFADGTTIRIDLAEDGLTFETVAEAEAVES